jgi:acyl-CoA synthetase (NDP forming)
VLIGGARLEGRRVAAISNSGASCVMAADAAERHGLIVEPLAPHTRGMLESVLPPFASAANPIDLTAALLSNSKLFSQVLPLLAPDDVADAYFISLPMSGKGYDVPQFAQDTASFAKQTGKPTVVASPLASTREAFERAGVATFEHDEDAMLALGQLARVTALQREAERLAGASARIVKASLPVSSAGFLSESDSLACLAEFDIPVAPYRLCRSRQELAAALRDVPGPWVVKACSAEIPHKTEYGLVKLGIADQDAAVSAFDTITEAVQKLDKCLDGVIVASMMRSQREMIIGARWDAQFGSIVMIGDGGKYVEAMPDVVTLIHPFDVEHCLARMRTLRMAPLFSGVRGEAPLPARRVAEIAMTLGNWVQSHAGRVKSADINPLMLGPAGAIAAADALVELAHA